MTFKSTRGARNALKSKLCASVDEWLEPNFIGHHLRGRWPTIEPVCGFDYMSGLNVSCLIDIFSYLDVEDLQKLSKVNQRFNHIVTNFMISRTNVQLFVKDLKNVHCFLKSFGSFVTKLKLHFDLYSNCIELSTELLLLIPKYCFNDYLECLDLSKISTNDFPIEVYRKSKIFSKLRVLTIQVSANESLMKEIVKLCPSLKTLRVRNVDGKDEMSGSFLKHLPVDIERVTIGAFVEEQFLNLFIERSLCLQELSCHIRTTTIIAKIVKHQPQLEKFEIQRLGLDMNDFSIDKYALSIKNFKQLKSFKLQYPWTMDVEMVNAVSEIDTVEDLVIYTESNGADLLLPAIKKMKNLKNLELSAYPSDTDTTNIWKQFFSTIANTNPNLENLDIDDVPFEYFLTVISGHPKLKKLVIHSMYLGEDEYEIFVMKSFRRTVKSRARGKQNFPIILKVEMNTEVRHFCKISNKYDHLVRIVDK